MNPTAPERVFRRRAAYLMTPEAYDRALTLLVRAAQEGGRVAAVIGIAGGGIRPAQEIAVRLGVPACHVAARHNDSDAPYIQATGTVEVTVPDGFPAALSGRVLLVDDICGTGATFAAVTDHLAPLLAADTRVDRVALCRNVGSPVRPAWWAWDVDDWVVFPWEPRPDLASQELPLPERIHTP
ncbi:phosphoribosyltransferase family protein [Streptomyces sp. NPDC086182]|uniref:phosphoribosyltransferase n=1 Tax=Streptomyces sp. NPDC086182 TaxID=3155058 RepID=UPI00343E41F7